MFSLNYLTPWSRVLFEELTSPQLLKKFPTFYGTRRFITAFTRAVSCARSIQSTHPHPTSLRSILILCSHLRLGLPSCLLPSSLSIKKLYAPILSPIQATCLMYLTVLGLITRMVFGEEYRA